METNQNDSAHKLIEALEALQPLLQGVQTQVAVPQPGDGDAARGKFSYILLGAGVALLTATLAWVPQLYPVGFGVAFTGFVFVLIWHFDRSFFPETNTFKNVAENPIATALVFCAIAFTIVESVRMGAVVFDVPADRSSEQSASLQSIEQSLREFEKRLAEVPVAAPPALDSARRGEGREAEREQ